jgi:hypothetical protein
VVALVKKELKLTTSPKTDTVLSMAEKKPKLGRPRTLPEGLNTRYQIRCSAKDVEAWEVHARKLGYVGTSAWIRKVVNDAIKQSSKRP